MNTDYKAVVEKKFGKPLKDIMYEVCIERRLEKWDGAKLIGVPENIFVAWRTKYRFGPLQWQADQAAFKRGKDLEKYNQELLDCDFNRTFHYKGENSMDSFKEVIERMLELAKFKRTKQTEDSIGEISQIMEIGILESTLEYINDFEKKILYEKVNRELKLLSALYDKD